ncbi:MAG: hypothetical protein AAF806_11760 [Bacteroidota bacterium]
MPADFESHKADFLVDIEMEWKENLGLYLIYINARVADHYAHAINLDSDEDNDIRLDQTTLKSDFLAYTSINWKDNVPGYLMYYKARAFDAYMERKESDLNSTNTSIRSINSTLSSHNTRITSLGG